MTHDFTACRGAQSGGIAEAGGSMKSELRFNVAATFCYVRPDAHQHEPRGHEMFALFSREMIADPIVGVSHGLAYDLP